MTAGAPLNGDGETSRSRDPACAENRAVLQCLTASLLKLLLGTKDFLELRIVAAEDPCIQFVEDALALYNPLRLGPRAGCEEPFRFGILQHLPVTRRFASGCIYRICPHQFHLRRRVILLFGVMPRPDIKSSHGIGPIG